MLLLTFPVLEKFLSIWLRDQFSSQILDLTKIFIIIAWLAGISHILITYFEGKEKILTLAKALEFSSLTKPLTGLVFESTTVWRKNTKIINFNFYSR